MKRKKKLGKIMISERLGVSYLLALLWRKRGKLKKGKKANNEKENDKITASKRKNGARRTKLNIV